MFFATEKAPLTFEEEGKAVDSALHSESPGKFVFFGGTTPPEFDLNDAGKVCFEGSLGSFFVLAIFATHGTLN